MKSGVRIIGGKWRGSKLAVVDAVGLRPTPDRVRETLFNWLAPYCRDAAVLDCFAGSGVLGFEAMSRGARSLVALENRREALAALRTAANRFDPEAIDIVGGDALESIVHLRRVFDMVFVDPPYAMPHLRNATLDRLVCADCLAPGARIYLEWPVAEPFDLLSSDFGWFKRKIAGQVNYAIAEWRASG